MMHKKGKLNRYGKLDPMLAILSAVCLVALFVLIYLIGKRSGESADAVAKSALTTSAAPPSPTTAAAASPVDSASSAVGNVVAALPQLPSATMPAVQPLLDAVPHFQSAASQPTAVQAAPVDGSALVGKWRVEGVIQDDSYYQFYSDGRFYQSGLLPLTGTYKLPGGNKLVEEFNGPLGLTSTLSYTYTLEGDELILTQEGVGVTTKCSRWK